MLSAMVYGVRVTVLKNTVIKLYLKQFTAILINVSAYGREPLAVPFGKVWFPIRQLLYPRPVGVRWCTHYPTYTHEV